MKYLKILLKLLTFGIVFMVSAIVFMFMTASYVPRLYGVNYYEHGCFDGVTSLFMEFSKEKGWPEKFHEKEELARKTCDKFVARIKKKGYLR